MWVLNRLVVRRACLLCRICLCHTLARKERERSKRKTERQRGPVSAVCGHYSQKGIRVRVDPVKSVRMASM